MVRPAPSADVDAAADDDFDHSSSLRKQGWLPTKAFVPPVKFFGPLLPPTGSEGACAMKQRWRARILSDEDANEGLDGFCEEALPREAEQTEILPFLYQSPGGRDPGRPSSIWSLDALRSLARLDCVQICAFDQCMFGLPARKPTTLLLLRLDTFKDLVTLRGCGGRCDHRAGHAPLQGRAADGVFATAQTKIYPRAMNRTIALAVSHFLRERCMYSGNVQVPEDLREFESHEFVPESIVPWYHGRERNAYWNGCAQAFITIASLASCGQPRAAQGSDTVTS
eukprot:s1470_g17.t1